VPFLPELHTFTVNIGAQLAQEDRVVVYEAIAYVISAMPMDQAAQWLKTFATSILAAVFALADKPTAATKQELQEVGSAFTHCIPRLFTEVAPFFPKTAWQIWKLCCMSLGHLENISHLPVRVPVKRCGLSLTRSWPSMARIMKAQSMSRESSAMLSISLGARC
jgi:hypothetical protein